MKNVQLKQIAYILNEQKIYPTITKGSLEWKGNKLLTDNSLETIFDVTKLYREITEISFHEGVNKGFVISYLNDLRDLNCNIAIMLSDFHKERHGIIFYGDFQDELRKETNKLICSLKAASPKLFNEC